jgi:predicted NBD/HSP70 family sugar kinase
MAARVNSTAIRRVNRVRLFHALREHPNSSQTDLQRLTGLDRGTTSLVVAQLLEEGLLTRGDPTYPGRVGRPETALNIAPSAGIFVGARLEPRKVRIISTNLAGELLSRLDLPGSTDIYESIALFREGLQQIIQSSGSDPAVRGIGVGVPGLMDRDGSLVLAPNLGWHRVPIRSLLQEGLEAPVYVDNDANAAAMAERLFGACKNCSNFAYLSCHSGLGAGLFMEGRLFRGVHGFSGEIGHVTAVPNGRACGCGKWGCVETYVSEGGILRTLSERGRWFSNLAEVADAARQQEVIVLEVLREVGQYLGMTLSGLVNLLNPEMVVLGGTLANVFEFLEDAMHKTMDVHVMPPLREVLRVILSPLGSEVVPMGGIALAMDGFISAPHLDTSLRPQPS